MKSIQFLIPLILTTTAVDSRSLIDHVCGSNQKERFIHSRQESVCCITTICHPGQKFIFCTMQDGFDTCQNCPLGLTHRDTIYTSKFDSEIDPCIEEEMCDGSDQKVINGICMCDLTNGYYGRDKNKCGVDDGTCRKQGHELTLDGYCKPCSNDHFKSKDSYALCTNKTRCSPTQEVDYDGSATEDRTCRAKVLPTKSTSPKPAAGPTKPEVQVTKLTNERISHENKTSKTQNTDNSTVDEEIETWIWIPVGVVCIFIGIVIGLIIWKRKGLCRTTGSDDRRSDNQIYHLVCCSNCFNTVNRKLFFLNGKNFIFGDRNRMVSQVNHPTSGTAASTPSDEEDTLMTDSGYVPDLNPNDYSETTVSNYLVDDDTAPKELYNAVSITLSSQTELKKPYS